MEKVVVSLTSPTPIYLQIVEQIEAQILGGQLSGGTQLPPIRAFANELNVSIITTKTAYDQLTKEGYTSGYHGRGTFINEFTEEELNEKRHAKLVKTITKDIKYLGKFNIGYDMIIDYINSLKK